MQRCLRTQTPSFFSSSSSFSPYSSSVHSFLSATTTCVSSLRFCVASAASSAEPAAPSSSAKRRRAPVLVGDAAAAAEEERLKREAEAAAAAERRERARREEFEASLVTEETVLQKVVSLLQQQHALVARTPLRMIAAQLTDLEHEVAATSAGLGGLRSLLQEHGSSFNLSVTQDKAGVYYVSSSQGCPTAEKEGDPEPKTPSVSSSSCTARQRQESPSSSSSECAIPEAPSATAFLSIAADEHFDALRRFLPCGFFIPLTALASSIPPDVTSMFVSNSSAATSPTESSSATAQVASVAAEKAKLFNALLAALARMKSSQVDVRVFGDKPGDVFVRAVCDNLEYNEAAGDFSGEVLHAKFDHAALAASLYESLRSCGRVAIAELPSVLPPDLLFRMPLKGFHCILVFERMPHLFYVNTTSYVVEARDLSIPTTISSSSSPSPSAPTEEAAKRIFTSLLTKNSPCPTELRYIVDNLVEPCSLDVVERELPKEMRGRIRCLFASLRDFVAVHSAYLFTDEGESGAPILCSHRLQQAAMDQEAMMLEDDEYVAAAKAAAEEGEEEAAAHEHYSAAATATSSSSSLAVGNGEATSASTPEASNPIGFPPFGGTSGGGFPSSSSFSIASKFAALQKKHLGEEGNSNSADSNSSNIRSDAEGKTGEATSSQQTNKLRIMLNNGFVKTVTEEEMQKHDEKKNRARERARLMRKAAERIVAYLPETHGLQIAALRRRLPTELDKHIYKKHPRNFFDLFPDLFFTFTLYSCPSNHYVQLAALPRPANAFPRCRSDADVIRAAACLLLTPKRLDIVQSRLPPDARGVVRTYHKDSLLTLLDHPKYREFFAVFRDKWTGEAAAMYIGHMDEERRQAVKRKLVQTGGTTFVTPMGFLTTQTSIHFSAMTSDTHARPF